MKLSLVIPVNNEEENLPLLFEDIYQALGAQPLLRARSAFFSRRQRCIIGFELRRT